VRIFSKDRKEGYKDGGSGGIGGALCCGWQGEGKNIPRLNLPFIRVSEKKGSIRKMNIAK